MKGYLTLAAFAAGSQALVSRASSCCFTLSSNGSPVGQLSDGQNRIGDNSLPAGQYCINGGSITDGQGRGCILTPPTTQLQCDVGATPTSGFSISSNGLLEYNGSPDFIACETGDNGGLNIYTTQSNDLSNCQKIELQASSCSSGNTPPPSTNCGAALSSGNYESPPPDYSYRFLVPNKAAGTSSNGEVTSTVSSIFNFDIPSSDSGKTCSLVFLFPEKANLQTSSFTFSGDGKIDVSKLSMAATTSTTFNNAPSVSQDFGDITVSPGNSYIISTFSCPAGQTVAYEMKNAGSTELNFFEDFNPAP
ncbi:uncharacterized protein N7477_002160 [Penicillium maclennaniae]|uniref:uncharacterized protein n=1 Tax=Penicillium maclennaniae TaxID=1343394 RepID=UPI002540FD66|nr:uncharacterized protein N7477_002160 [Penicillium maclennaniae]KAJ5676527.1 hypothetical protein N7477_002160 [Penicillium maclennaniae]